MAPVYGREVDYRNDLVVQVSSPMSSASTVAGRAGASIDNPPRSRTDSGNFTLPKCCFSTQVILPFRSRQ